MTTPTPNPDQPVSRQTEEAAMRAVCQHLKNVYGRFIVCVPVVALLQFILYVRYNLLKLCLQCFHKKRDPFAKNRKISFEMILLKYKMKQKRKKILTVLDGWMGPTLNLKTLQRSCRRPEEQAGHSSDCLQALYWLVGRQANLAKYRQTMQSACNCVI